MCCCFESDLTVIVGCLPAPAGAPLKQRRTDAVLDKYVESQTTTILLELLRYHPRFSRASIFRLESAWWMQILSRKTWSLECHRSSASKAKRRPARRVQGLCGYLQGAGIAATLAIVTTVQMVLRAINTIRIVFSI